MPATALPTRGPKKERLNGLGSAPRICLVGCGAIAESLYLPALAAHPEVVRRLVLVDPDINRARAAGARYGVTDVVGATGDVFEDVDGVIVATPPHAHFDLALKAIRSGCHVLCEKPLTTSQGDAIALVQEASAAGVSLAVNNTRRLFPASVRVRQLLREGALGEVQSISYVEGFPFEWPTASGFYFQGGSGAQGVLSDIGSHVVDLLCWWIGTRPRLLSYFDDSMGGPEAVAHLRLAFGDAEAEVRLSRLSTLENRYRIIGTTGSVEGDIVDRTKVVFIDRNGRERLLNGLGPAPASAGSAMVDNFLEVVGGQAQPLVPASEVVPSIVVLHEAYARRERLKMPWVEVAGHEA